MARSRTPRASTAAAEPSTNGQSGGELVCPECGKTFNRPASLGAHRRQAHGVAGAAHAGARRTTRRRRATSSPRTTTSTARRQAGVDRDALLGALFPNGIPPREELIRSVNAWLDEAERLTKSS